MRAWAGTVRTLAAGSLLGLAAIAGAAAPHATDRVVDAGLHRQWRIERDAAHPERPPRLVEAPWSAEPQAERRKVRKELAVQAGMQVIVRERSAASDMELRGTALGSGAVGERIWVSAGLHGMRLRARVRGSGVVELVGGAK